MATEVFNRYERKYLLTPETADTLCAELADYMVPDRYSRDGTYYTISNLYFDTEDNELIRTSLAKPNYKEKLRLRAYGVPGLDTLVYLEIKKKYRGFVNKRRTNLLLRDAYDFTETGVAIESSDYTNRQVIEEIAYFLRVHQVAPRLYLAYDRRALFSAEDPNLRITFDFDIRSRRYNLRMELGDYGDLLMPDGEVVMEIKTPMNIPLWLTGILSKNGVFGRSFSKYGCEYMNLLANRNAVLEVSREESKREVYAYV